MYDVKLIQQPTGRVHNVVGQGITPILDETTGEPETEYILVALIDDHYVSLQSFTAGYIEHQVGRPDTAADQSSSSSSPAPAAQPAAAASAPAASPPEGEGTAGEGAAQQQPPAEQATS